MSNATPWKVGVIGAVACGSGFALVLVDWTRPQLVAFLAMLFIALGALHIVTTSFGGLDGAFSALVGIAELAVGLILLAWPSPTLLVVVVVVGVWTVARAVTVVTIVVATRKDHRHWRVSLVPFGAELVLGAWLLARSSGTVREVALLTGAVVIVEGVTGIGTAVSETRHHAPSATALVEL